MKVTIDCPKKRIADLLITAFEGGSNYWYLIEEFIEPPKVEFWADEDGLEPFKHVDYPLSPGGALIISVTDEEEALAADPRYPKGPHRLDLDNIEKGLALFAEKHPIHFANWLSEQDDAETADVFLQCCLFNGEVIFG